jgi:two-component system NarL family response regulator
MRRGARVLIVDDSAPFRRAAARLVAEVGAAITDEVATGEEALAVVGASVPDLVLMDVHLPGISGVEATRRLCAEHPGVRVLLLSSYAAAELPAAARECGAVGYVSKADLDRAAVDRALRPQGR